MAGHLRGIMEILLEGLHGRMYVHSLAEVERHERLGWRVVAPKPVNNAAEGTPENLSLDDPSPSDTPKRKMKVK